MKFSVSACVSAAAFAFAMLLFAPAASAQSTTYEVGPGKAYANIGDVPWESLQPGATVLIYYRSTPYREKWVICRQGTASAPIVVRGVAGPNGELPVVDGNGATTRLALDFWSETRGVIKIGGASIPADTTPSYITIENLDVRSARTPYTFTDDSGASQTYSDSASAIYVEKGQHIVVRNCVLSDSGNGFFVASSDEEASRDILVERCSITNNGIANSIYQHNNYTAAIGMVFQYNYFGPLRAGCLGNNLKDRSAGLVVRYNWIEGGNRQLDLVDGEDSILIRTDPSYRSTFVYGNVLVERAGDGNRQIAHYGGDSGTTGNYRGGTLYFYDNTVVSYRTDRTTLFRLSTNGESCDARNNVFYTTAAGTSVSMLDQSGLLTIRRNWIKPGWVNCFGTLDGSVNDDGSSVQGASPGFANEAGQDFHPGPGSACVDAGAPLLSAVLPANDVVSQYVKHRAGEPRPNDGARDIGAFEASGGTTVQDLVVVTPSLPGATAGTAYSATVAASGGVAPYAWSIVAGSLPPGLALGASTGAISGTPSTAGSYSFTLRVSDAQLPADTASRAYTIAVAPAQVTPPAITTSALPDARRGIQYAATVTASGGLTPYTWSLASGSLPPGLALNASTGAISGKATRTGTWAFTVRVRDAQSPAATATRALSIRVRR